MSSSKPKKHLWLAVALVAVVVAILIGGRAWLRPRITQSDLRKAIAAGDHASALKMLQTLLDDGGESGELLLKAGEAASKLGKLDEAIGYYQRVDDSDSRHAATARWACGEIDLHREQMSLAMKWFSESLRLDPSHEGARNRLIYLLNLSGRRWDAVPHLFALVQSNRANFQQMVYLGNTAKSIENEKELIGFLNAAPHDTMPLLGIARIRIRLGEYEEAANHLSKVIEQFPELIEAHVQLAKSQPFTSPESFRGWNSKLPGSSDNHPDIWVLRGDWARTQQDWSSAIQCYAEALRIDPEHLGALQGLGQAFGNTERLQDAKVCFHRASVVEQFHKTLERILVDEFEARKPSINLQPQDVAARTQTRLQSIIQAARQTLELGRVWEAEAWLHFGMMIDPNNEELLQLKTLTNRRMNRSNPRSFDPVFSAQLASWHASVLDKSRFAKGKNDKSLDPQESDKQANSVLPPSVELEQANIRFQAVPDAFQFTYFASRNEPTDGRRMFEFTGGGMGVLDFDLDGWPDVFMAQGCEWPVNGSDVAHSDCLKRNVVPYGGSAFVDVSRSAGIIEARFGQGVAIGDINSDGFEDIYVCNIGRNQLWINQGDGTFGDGEGLFESSSESWTVGAAIFDWNGDGLPEIYDANYVEGSDVYTRRCILGGLPRACSPLNFGRAKGTLWQVTADGSIRDLGRNMVPPELQDGNALGLSLFRIHGESQPSLFIANDQVANILLSPVPDDSKMGWRLEDRAMTVGLAFDGDGRPQACMGVATGDVNGDGRLDLLVTNYYDEANTLYLQQEGGVFQDASKLAGLVAPSLKMLGFGAQFIDAELDGNLDLVVLNGHVDDMSHMGIPYRMRAQFFSGNGKGQFQERREKEIGEFFADARLGRALAWFDFDRDGRQDLIAGDLNTTTELLRNTSRKGNHLVLQLVGTVSNRNAVGAQVVLHCGEKSWTHQVTAGNGYLVTNSKSIHQGLGSLQRVDRIEIEWPSGSKQTFYNVPANSSWIAIEGIEQLQNSALQQGGG